MLNLYSCGNVQEGDKKEINIGLVNLIEIRNHAAQIEAVSDSFPPFPPPIDSVPVIRKRLTDEESKVFISKWNNGKSKGLCKFIPVYWIDVTLKDGTKRIFRTNAGSIKEDNDICFDLEDKEYVQKLWNKK